MYIAPADSGGDTTTAGTAVPSAPVGSPRLSAVTRRAQRGLETREAIQRAAATLFGSQGFENVTMRQIAQEAACSHTAIYLYYADKHSLLEAIALEPLEKLRDKIKAIVEAGEDPQTRLVALSNTIVRFCLDNRRLYRVFLAAAAGRVDMPQAEGTLNHLRNDLFGQLRNVVAMVTGAEADSDSALRSARVYFYMLQGIIATYDQSAETSAQLAERLGSTFDYGFRALISGLIEVKS